MGTVRRLVSRVDLISRKKILYALANANRPLNAAEIASSTGIGRETVVAMLEAMLAQELVGEESSEELGRYSITVKGLNEI